jgi:membrane protein CcdC involved in cytochrome C biogenesis
MITEGLIIADTISYILIAGMIVASTVAFYYTYKAAANNEFNRDKDD